MRPFKLLFRCAAVLAICSTAMGSAFADTFALVNINQQALFFNQINEGAQKAADAAGAKLVIFNANNVPSAQNDAIENYITQKVDGIILVAIDVNGVKPAITAAKAAGIPVIAIDAQIPDGDDVAFIGVDNAKAGEDIGKFYADYVKSEMGGTAKIGIVGALNSFIQNQRLDGFKKAVTDSGLAITFLDTVDGQNVQETAMSASENLMTANPDMTTLYATGEPALLGAVSAVTSQGRTGATIPCHEERRRTGDVKVFGWDLTKQVIQGIDDGWVVAVVQQDPAGEGKAAVEALVKLKKGETVEPIINIPVTIVTKDNVEQYRAMFQ